MIQWCKTKHFTCFCRCSNFVAVSFNSSCSTFNEHQVVGKDLLAFFIVTIDNVIFHTYTYVASVSQCREHNRQMAFADTETGNCHFLRKVAFCLKTLDVCKHILNISWCSCKTAYNTKTKLEVQRCFYDTFLPVYTYGTDHTHIEYFEFRFDVSFLIQITKSCQECWRVAEDTARDPPVECTCIECTHFDTRNICMMQHTNCVTVR